MKKDLGTVIVEYFTCMTKEEQAQLMDLLWELGRNIDECGYEHHIGTSGTERENNPHTDSNTLYREFYQKFCDEYNLTPEQRRDRDENQEYAKEAQADAVHTALTNEVYGLSNEDLG